MRWRIVVADVDGTAGGDLVMVEITLAVPVAYLITFDPGQGVRLL